MTLVLIIGGALLGFSVFWALCQLLPSPPHLASAMERLHVSPLDAVQALTDERGASARGVQRVSRVAASTDLRDRIGTRVAHLVRNIAILQPPQHDLRLLGTTTSEWFGEKAVWALLGLLSPALFYVATCLPALATGGTPLLPLQLPLLLGPLVGIFTWFVPDLQLKGRVSAARMEFKRAIAAYIEFVAMERRSGMGQEQSLANAAAIGQSWPFQRLQQQLLRCKWSGIRPWDGLHELSREVGVIELAELAETMRLSTEEGVHIYRTLRARATSMRNAQVSADQTEANAVTERINGPLGLLVMMFGLFIVTPMLLQTAL
jgi:hypothetical protein